MMTTIGLFEKWLIRAGTCLVLGALVAGSAATETFGAWTLDLPKGAVVSGPDDGLYEVRENGLATYRLAAPMPANGKSPRQFVDDFAAGLSTLQPAFEPDVAIPQSGGGTAVLRVGAVTDPVSGQVSAIAIGAFPSGDKVGLFIANLHDEAVLLRLGALLESVAFNPQPARLPPPSGAKAGPATGPSTGATTAPVSSPKPSDVWPRGGLVAASRPGVSVPQAIAMGLDPYTDLLPDTFECYLDNGEDVADPTPIGRMIFDKGGTYQWTGPGAGSGRWSQARRTDDRAPVTLSGPIERQTDDGVYVLMDEHGQSFIMRKAAGDGTLGCYQQGPAAENHRLTIARKIIAPGPMQCQLATGGTLNVNFTERGYTSAGGNGTFEVGVEGVDERPIVHNWMTGGPFDKARGDYEEDDEGFRTLQLAIHISERRTFYAGSRTEPVAVCTGKSAPRPHAKFGAAQAPKPAGPGGLDGLFVTIENRYGLYGTEFVSAVYKFLATGWFWEIEEGPTDDADCARTRPNGAPVCRQYALSGKTIRLQDEDAPALGTAQTFVRQGTGFEIDDASYSRVPPLTGFKVNATYTLDRAVSSGGIGQPSGSLLRWQKQYTFKSSGRFEFSGSTEANTYLNGGLFGGGVIGGGSSSSGSSGNGTYAVSGNTMTLKFDDGRTEQLHVHNLGDGWTPGSAPPEYVWIDGEQLELQN